MGNTQEKTKNTRITYDREYIKDFITKRLKNSGLEKVEAYLNSMLKYEFRLWTDAQDLTLDALDHFYALAELDYKINAEATNKENAEATNKEKKQLEETEKMTAEIETLEAELAKLSERTITLAETNSKQKAIKKEKCKKDKAATITRQKKRLKVQLNKLSDKLRKLYNERERIIKIQVGLPFDIQINF